MTISDETKPLRKRSQRVTYYKKDQTYSFYLKDSTVFGSTERITFSFKNMQCSIQKLPFEPAKFTVNDQLIADWRVPVKSPMTTQVRLLDENFKDDSLLIIGCLHGYYNAAGY